MKVMVMVKATTSSEAGEKPSKELLTAMGHFNEELAKSGILLAGEGLRPSRQGVRVRFSGDSRIVNEGPFNETEQLLAGFWIWQVDSMQHAIDWVRRCPNPMPEDSDIEIRPIYEMEDFADNDTPELREQEARIKAMALGLAEPSFEMGREMLLVGLQARYTPDSSDNISAQWQRFVEQKQHIRDQINDLAYGVSLNWESGHFDYLTALEVASTANQPEEFTDLHLPQQRYAVFEHLGHVSQLPETYDRIWSAWVPQCGLRVADAPSFERYTEEFDAESGTNGIEVWIPMQV